MKTQTNTSTVWLLSGALLLGGLAWQAGGDDSISPQKLRADGPVGLQKFLTSHEREIAAHQAKLRDANFTDEAGWRLLSQQLDSIAGQRDAWSSRLYWFTDLEAAKAAAKVQGKPILSLRMLGKLTDGYSCANSRFFRTALYANAQISRDLREGFILHWSSERPVPVVTIDMGDGRILKRTLTGNSAHYLLDTKGRPLDALPGLYSPGVFREWLGKGKALFKECEGQSDGARLEKLKSWHEAQILALADQYMAELRAGNPGYWKKAEPKTVEQTRSSALQSLKNTRQLEAKAEVRVPASRANRLAVSKAIAEMPVLNATVLYQGSGAFSREQVAYWTGLKPHLEKARLDENSRLLLRSQRPVLDSASTVTDAAQANVGASFVQFSIGQVAPDDAQAAHLPDDPFERLVDNFERNIALDTARNEWNLHAPLHQWFATHAIDDFATLNRLVYDKLFLTPQSDQWLGLSPAGNYTGLADSGLFEALDTRNINKQRQARFSE